jgi:hypothetical protein
MVVTSVGREYGGTLGCVWWATNNQLESETFMLALIELEK